MLAPHARDVKPAPLACAQPPWDRTDPRWIDIDRRLPPDHLARLIDQAVDRLDLTPLFASYAGTGSPPHPPDLMLKLALFELRRSVQSPARWADDVRWRDELKWLTFGLTPSRSRLYAFRDRLGPLLDDFHRQVLQQGIALGLTTATHAALDGTATPAAASRRRLLRRKALDRRLDQLDRAIAADEAEPSGPPEPRPWWMARTPRGRLAQRQRYRQADQQLQARVEQNARRRSCKRRDPEAIVVSPSEPEAAVGRDKSGVFGPLYNVQLAYDLDSELVLGFEVFAQQNDAGTLAVMLEGLTRQLGHPPLVVLADSAYANVIDAGLCVAAGVTLYASCPADDAAEAEPGDPAEAEPGDRAEAQPGGPPSRWLPKSRFTWDEANRVYRCPAGQAMPYERRRTDRRAGDHEVVLEFYRCPGEHCQSCPLRSGCTPNPEAGRSVSRAIGEEHVEALRARMAGAEAQALYRRRRETVERGFADLKWHRRLGRFGSRGVARARIQVGLTVLVHNLLVVARQAGVGGGLPVAS